MAISNNYIELLKISAVSSVIFYALGIPVLAGYYGTATLIKTSLFDANVLLAGIHFIIFLLVCCVPIYPYFKYFYEKNPYKALGISDMMRYYRDNWSYVLLKLVETLFCYVVFISFFSGKHFVISNIKDIGWSDTLANLTEFSLIATLVLAVELIIFPSVVGIIKSVSSKKISLSDKMTQLIYVPLSLFTLAFIFGQHIYERIPYTVGGGQYKNVVLFVNSNSLFNQNFDGAALYDPKLVKSVNLLATDNTSYYLRLNIDGGYLLSEIPKNDVKAIFSDRQSLLEYQPAIVIVP